MMAERSAILWITLMFMVSLFCVRHYSVRTLSHHVVPSVGNYDRHY